MNRVRFLAKIAMVVSIFATLTFTVSCSDDKENKDDNDGGTKKWCVIGQGEGQRCAEIGAKYKSEIDPSQQKMTEEVCNMYGAANASIKDEKPSDCIVITE